jgi:glucosamine--fructose-6-phosphate aminotransferase (isomerizing)
VETTTRRRAMTSAMRETMWRQPADARAMLADPGPVEAVAERLRGRRLFLVGTGTSWHAANHSAWFLRAAGVDARPVQGMDAAVYGVGAGPDDGVVVLSHRNTKRFTTQVGQEARAAGIAVAVVGGKGSPDVDIETTEPERSAAFTASHLGCLLRMAQLATVLGAELGDLALVPGAVEEALAGQGPGVEVPPRLLELTGAGPNQWTAAEGALKVRETSWVATEGLSVEQLLHGPAVALDARDALVCLDGGGPGAERVEAVADAAEQAGARSYRIEARALGEQLSVFPLTVAVQRIALDAAESLGRNPDDFRASEHEAWRAVGL